MSARAATLSAKPSALSAGATALSAEVTALSAGAVTLSEEVTALSGSTTLSAEPPALRRNVTYSFKKFHVFLRGFNFNR
ncbi:hypothetical protein [Sporosarcina sp. UB5]|uniref:hypothetical protein n=1 Tax=Sporosarcina sp. UB5 TaxID=3047463 RepID=UPI003D7AE7C9